MNLFKRIRNKLLLDKYEKIALSFLYQGYLMEVGWWNSEKEKFSVDSSKRPIPWLTYSIISFLEERLTNDFDVFEYGSGASTLYYAQKVKSITAIEHDQLWYEKILALIPDNVNLKRFPLHSEQYINAIQIEEKLYDLVIIDGRDRIKCLKEAISCIKEDGVIILDDSQRNEYFESNAFMKELKFKKIDFWGISPGEFKNKSTTIFYRSSNCLKI